MAVFQSYELSIGILVVGTLTSQYLWKMCANEMVMAQKERKKEKEREEDEDEDEAMPDQEIGSLIWKKRKIKEELMVFGCFMRLLFIVCELAIFCNGHGLAC